MRDIKFTVGFSTAIACLIALSGCLSGNKPVTLPQPQTGSGTPSSACPNTLLNETAADCPWAQASRDTTNVSNPDLLRSIIDSDIPGFMAEIDRDGNSKALLGLWGLSSNIDASNIATGLHTIPDK